MGMGRQLDAELDGFLADGVQRVGADLDLLVADVIARRAAAIVHLEMIAIAERLDEITRELDVVGDGLFCLCRRTGHLLAKQFNS